jgi:thiamine-monophosphate kinase
MNPFSNRRSDTVAALGEAALIQAIRRWLGPASPPPPRGIGDDCAVLAPARRRQLLTVDPVIYRRHFDDRLAPERVGQKLLKRNLSDLAAMGGRPTAAVIALTLDPRARVDWLRRFHRGLAGCARRYGVPIVGGDVAQADGVLAASLALLGTAVGPRLLTRAGARRGDWIYVTGVLGRSSGSGHHWRFTPRLAEGAWFARRPEVRAMMDVSDGLAKDLWALTPKGTEPAVDPSAVPRRPGASLSAALQDGEDYELAVALSASADRNAFERAWRRAFPHTRLRRIGRFLAPADLPSGSVRLRDYRGYEHLR